MRGMTSFRDLIAARREEVKRQITELKAELREITLAEAAIKSGVLDGASTQGQGSRGKHTIKDMVVSVLSSRLEGAEASDIVNFIANEFGEEVPRSSLSPQLSRLKEEGALILDGRIWKLNRQEDRADFARSSVALGGGEVRGEALPTDSPEGANPSTSIHNHQAGSEQTDDDLWS